MAVLARVEKTFSKPVLVFLVPSVSMTAKVKRRFAQDLHRILRRPHHAVAERSRHDPAPVRLSLGDRALRRRAPRALRADEGRASKPGRYRARVVETGVPGVQAFSVSKRLR